jgi:hypothetical protein
MFENEIGMQVVKTHLSESFKSTRCDVSPLFEVLKGSSSSVMFQQR